MKLDSALQGVTKLGLDTPVFIYFADAVPINKQSVTYVLPLLPAGFGPAFCST